MSKQQLYCVALYHPYSFRVVVRSAILSQSVVLI